MSAIRPRWLPLADEAATVVLGARLAHQLPAQTAPLVLYLHGDLGAGKTTLARGILQALGETGPVRSPTYSLVAEYQPAGQRVLHLDLYRLNSPDELRTLGLTDYLPGSRLWLVEWPDRGEGGGLPAPDASLYLEPVGTARRARFVAVTPSGHDWAAAVEADSGS
ncbi:MAG TPA: tRNA (adenosine(37)-N6)-threonylcarbamoyltransferase complex ATPase subunit type 1 TsaE [Steroidobacteraceae bacterium]|nr:tRNA (adenosine(37)-N6)-threonylcarbamoyltransferase complex ATPase subunit type 1 TsaE [Steroidobacteraceae bacterium]